MITVIRIGISLDIYVWTRLITFAEYQKQLCDMTLTPNTPGGEKAPSSII